MKKINKYIKYLVVSCAVVNITACNSGSPAPSPTNTTYAIFANSYATSNSSSYTQCQVNESGIESSSCTTITPAGSVLDSPTGIAFSGNHAYFINVYGGTTSSYTQCSLNGSGIDADSCTIYNMPTELNDPNGMAINGGYAYIPDSQKDNYMQCVVNGSGIDVGSCQPFAPAGLSKPASITFNGSYAYFANYGSDRYTQCSVDSSGIIDSSCTTVNPSNPSSSNGDLNQPSGIAFSGDYAYFANYRGNSYTQCSVDSSGIIPSTCKTTPGSLNGAWDVTVSGSYAYFVNKTGNSYTQCSINPSSGIIANSCIEVTPKTTGALHSPAAIAIISLTK